MPTILVIEDEGPVRENIVELLEAEGYQALSAENGVVGVQLAREKRPDLIVCDIIMPKLDGYGVWGMLNKETATSTIPFIFLTAKTDRSDLRRGMELGVDDYIAKPFTREELLQAIRVRLTKREVVAVQAQKKFNDLRSSITLSLPHEMLTPLSVVLGFSEYLMMDGYEISREQIVDIAHEIQTAAQRLLRTTQNYLLFAELELIATDPKRLELLRQGCVDSAAVAISEIAGFKARQEQREASLHLNLVDGRVRISENYLQRMVEELLDNAFKYSPVESPVSIESHIDEDKGCYVFAIIDHGRGMTLDQIAEIDSFIQFDRKIYEQQGIGLGLVVTRRVAELHQGSLNIVSQPGKMTNVTVCLPLDGVR